jgi:hypothetical protein
MFENAAGGRGWFFSEFHIDKTEYGDYTAIKQQLRRFLDEVYMYKRIHSTLG